MLILPLNIFTVSVIHTVLSVSVGMFSGKIVGQGSCLGLKYDCAT